MLKRNKINCDVCVIGGGISGMCAAIRAARCGASVVLMHERPVLGGNASSEIRMWICGAHGENNRESGIIEEIALENMYYNPTKNYYIWDALLYDFVKREKNITLLLNCTCMDAKISTGDYGHGRNIKITEISGYQMTTQSYFDICAENYIDASGDSILAPLTGAEYMIGRESRDEFSEPTYVEKHDSLTMGMSCLVEGRETTKKVDFTPMPFATKLTGENFKHRRPNLYNSSENFWYLELGGNRDSIHDTEDVRDELVSLALGTWDYVKNSTEFKSDNFELEFLGFLPGKRESRRMLGEYVITANDILGNEKFKDTVAYGGWPIDDHYPDGFYHRGIPNTNIQPDAPYSIPYRALYSKNVSNLLFAGRNISMTHMAMSSVRVMATCALIGEAVGCAAYLCKKYGLTPHGVYLKKIDELQKTLMDADLFIPYKRREVSKLCASTPISGGDDSLKNGEDRVNKVYGNHPLGTDVINGQTLEYRFTAPVYIRSCHITFDSDLDRKTLNGDSCERTHSTRANILLDSPRLIMPKTLCKSFRLTALDSDGKETELLSSDNNLRRSYHIDIDMTVTALRLTPLENYGGTQSTKIFSFDFQD